MGLPQKCNPSGTGYDDQAPCPSDHPFCDPATGGCSEPCKPHDLRCNPSRPVIQQCDQQGIWRDTLRIVKDLNVHGGGVGMAMHIGQSFLQRAEERDFNRIR